MRKILVMITMMLLAAEVHAIGGVSDATVTRIRVDVNGRAMIFFDRPIGRDPATCVHDAYKNAFAVDASTEGGKAVLSMALAAKTTGSTVTAYGLGKCGVYGGEVIETWNHGFIN